MRSRVSIRNSISGFCSKNSLSFGDRTSAGEQRVDIDPEPPANGAA